MMNLKSVLTWLAALAATSMLSASMAVAAEQPAAVSEELPLSKEAKAVQEEEQGLSIETKRERTLVEQLVGKAGQPLSRDQQMSLGTELKKVQERKSEKLEELGRKRERLARNFDSQANSTAARGKIQAEGGRLNQELGPMKRGARTRARIATITGDTMSDVERRDLTRRKKTITRIMQQLPRIDAALEKERRSRDRASDMASYQRALATECRIRSAAASLDATETDLALRVLALEAANKGSIKGGDALGSDEEAPQPSLIDLLHLESPEPVSAPGDVPVEEWVKQLSEDGVASALP